MFLFLRRHGRCAEVCSDVALSQEDAAGEGGGRGQDVLVKVWFISEDRLLCVLFSYFKPVPVK